MNIEEHNKRVQMHRELDKLEEEDKGDVMLGWALAFIIGCFIWIAVMQLPKAIDNMWQDHYNKPEYVKQAETESKLKEIKQGQ